MSNLQNQESAAFLVKAIVLGQSRFACPICGISPPGFLVKAIVPGQSRARNWAVIVLAG